MPLITCLVAALGTGHVSLAARYSPGKLLDQIATSTASHIRGTPQEDFDCHWRQLAMQWAPKLQPWLNETQQRQLFDALELDPVCGKPFQPTASLERTSGAGSAVGFIVYVDAMNGNDGNSGTLTKPLASIKAAVTATRDARSSALTSTNATIALRAGTFYLNETIELDARDSGLTIGAYQAEEVIVSGGVALSGLNWKPTTMDGSGAPVHVASLSGRSLPRGVPALHHRGQRATLARYPNANPELDLFPKGYIVEDTSWLPPTFHGAVCDEARLCGASENRTIAVSDAWHGS